MKRFRTYFLGCKANQSDVLSYAGILQQAGWREATAAESPDLIVVQTCTVTMSADAQGRQMIRRLKRENPGSRILITGCYAQRAESELTALPGVDCVIGNLNPRKFEILSSLLGSPISAEFPDFPMPADTGRTRPYVKIQEGCDARCSYCIIPSVRGKSRSLPPEEILRRIQTLLGRGYKEMILTGISMGGYGKDLSPRTGLSDLIRRIDALPGNFRVRLSSVEPEEIDQGFIEAFTSSPRMQPHLHLPLQSASDRVLKRMRRQYLFRRYDWIVNEVFKRMPELNLGTDILVGFPEEGREEYLQTSNYLEGTPYGYAHVFPFSPRPGTPAADFSNAAANAEVTERAAELRAIARTNNLRYRSRFRGKIRKALLLHPTSRALTDNYIRVELCNWHQASGLCTVRIEDVTESMTKGRVIAA